MEKLVKYFTDSLDENMNLQKLNDHLYRITFERDDDEDE